MRDKLKMLMDNYKSLIIGGVILLLFIYFLRSGCGNSAIAVRAVPVKQGGLIASVSVIGTIKPAEEIIVRAQTDCVVQHLLVQEGDKVKQGQPLLFLNNLTGNIVVKSPLNGVVLLIEETTEKGATVKAGQTLLTIGDLSRLIIEADINEIEAKSLKKGQEVKITSDAYRQKVFQGRVKTVAPQVQEIEGVAKVPVTIDVLSSSPFKPGNRVDVEVITAQKDDVYYVPLEAVITSQDKKNIYVLQGNRARKLNVQTGISNINYIEVIPAKVINPAVQVIISNNPRLKDGVRVRLTK